MDNRPKIRARVISYMTERSSTRRLNPVDTKRRDMQRPKFLHGYKQASEFSEWPKRRLERLVESRQIRAIKPNRRTIVFVAEHLLEDLMSLEVPKL